MTLVHTITEYTYDSSALQSRASRAAQAGACTDAPTLRHVQAHVRVVHAGAAQLHGDQKQHDYKFLAHSPWLLGVLRWWWCRGRSGVLNRPLTPAPSPPFPPAATLPNRRSCMSNAAPWAGCTRGCTTSADGSASFSPSLTTSRNGESSDSSPPARAQQ